MHSLVRQSMSWMGPLLPAECGGSERESFCCWRPSWTLSRVGLHSTAVDECHQNAGNYCKCAQIGRLSSWSIENINPQKSNFSLANQFIRFVQKGNRFRTIEAINFWHRRNDPEIRFFRRFAFFGFLNEF